ncbi:alpha-1,3-mannosyl-glycoprotein 4-beta-N-acetylglucosaminyltransferase C [Pimephales promelas]|uniref:alpha-1,3-mannosyl-glycoprotein 4-beta-N-acetylglucosaminyltransferase C n=1 Tax=Pimephales promelas TaxID=90988 RepID=UPI0019556E0B|nr:alpha-1,3-mannosyl-glycoprotein 4-beta-N-acetylglucosaminyltransferase C [Pimephales promelas]XP_039519933.1 alpha-1,3-mannosyl-glycoprotein 4-beta-N-acetylglucosaminyltransferase C [Pimephales promelas]
MRCYLKKSVLVGAGLLILTSVYIYMQRAESGQVKDSVNWIWDRETWVEDLQSHYLHFNVSIKVLAGDLQQSKKYLTVGLSSVKRKKGSYLQDTLRSIFTESSEEEQDQMVVVVLLADFDVSWIQETSQKITDEFHLHLSKGRLLVIHVNEENYPPLTGLKRNFNDAPDRVSFRSKQNVDYSYLLHFSSNLSQYYIMLEDDVSCSKNFLSSMREHINSMSNSKWVTLEFSKLGYIGKLYQSKDLPILGRFLYNFYQEMPCDFLLSHFHKLLMQDKVIRFRPSLFQHMGTYSSFRGTFNHLKDEDFVEEVADNPPADIRTNIETFETNTAEKAYSQDAEYFWGMSPIGLESYFLVVFHEPVLISRVQVQTGLDGKDQLVSADVELGKTLVKTETAVDCSGFQALGYLQNGQFNEPDVQKLVPATVSCLRIRVTAPQSNWVIINRIQVWTVKAERNTREAVSQAVLRQK